MNRPGHDSIKYFTGNEVEHTPAYGQATLFVVGVQLVEEIEQRATLQKITHIFFGANHSYDPQNYDEHLAWQTMIEYFLKKDYLCSLDIPMSQVEEFNEGGLSEYNNFIGQIRVAIPYAKLWNYNTMIKIDDRDFAATNPGVWCHSLHSLMNRDNFTGWQEYTKDKEV